MGRLIYSILMSLDGYIEDPSGSFDWAEPDAEVHRVVNDLARPVGTHLYGRRMYEVMQAWETLDREPGQPDYIVDFARIWQAADKIVFSSSLEAPSTSRTALERRFDPDAVRERKRTSEADLMIGGPGLAAEAFDAGLVDVVHLFVAPVTVGGGKPAMPRDVRIDLELESERRFGNGMAQLAYRVRSRESGVGTLSSP